MSKKSIATVVLLGVMTAGLAAPAFAQSQQSGSQGGFFGMFASFFSKMFHQGGQSQGTNDQTGTASGTLTGVPTGTMDQGRLQGLVTAGKITQSQAQEIQTEIAKIKSEIQSWSSSTGIDAGYIYGGLRGQGMDVGIAPTGGTQQGVMQGRPLPATTGVQGHSQGGRLPGGSGIMAPRGNQQ